MDSDKKRGDEREPTSNLFFMEPPPPWETPDDFIATVQSVWGALGEREHRPEGVKLAAWMAGELWKDCLPPSHKGIARIKWTTSSPPPECPDLAAISQYDDPFMVRLPEDAVARVRGVLASVLRWADAEKKAQDGGDQVGAGERAQPEDVQPDADGEDSGEQDSLTVNDRMMQVFTKDKRCVNWSQRDWGEKYGVTPGAIAKTAAWRAITTERARQKEALKKGGYDAIK